MAQLNLDVTDNVITEIQCTFTRQERQAALRSLGLVSRDFNYASRPLLFSSVKWPHPKKHDNETGLHFFPEGLWPYFRTFFLDWPDYWPDVSPPAWGTTHPLEGYIPKHLDKLEHALPRMSKLHTFQMTCPFYPPKTLLLAIVASPALKDLRVADTPIKAGLSPSPLPATFTLDRLSFTPVGETSRVGEGPFPTKYHDITYYTRSYRRRHSTDASNGGGGVLRIMPGWALVNIFSLARPDSLRHLQISGSYCALHDFNGTWWPRLETLVLTGPEAIPDSTHLADVVGRMPSLRDLRVLFNKALPGGIAHHHQPRPCFRVVDPSRDAFHAARSVQHVSPPTVFQQITHFAASNICDLASAFTYFTSLSGLALIAVINHPRVPIARGEEEIHALLDEMRAAGSGKQMKVLRVMLECAIRPGLIAKLGGICPVLEVLEVEVCGYRDGPPEGFVNMVDEWCAFGDALQGYTHIKQLRIGVVFSQLPDTDTDYDADTDTNTNINDTDYEDADGRRQHRDRSACARYLASRVPTLQRIGFEYRMRTGSHRYEDRWLDFDIVRGGGGEGDDGKDEIVLREVEPNWYPFPEVWNPVPL